jgi:hypothetical protein
MNSIRKTPNFLKHATVVYALLAASVGAHSVEVIVDDTNPAPTANVQPIISAIHEDRNVEFVAVTTPSPRFRLAIASLKAKLGLTASQMDLLIRIKMESPENIIPYWVDSPAFTLSEIPTSRRVWLLSPERYYQKRIEQAMKFESEAKVDPEDCKENRWLEHFANMQDALDASGITPGMNHLVRVGTGLEIMIKTNSCTPSAQGCVNRWFQFFDNADQQPALKNAAWAQQEFSDICNAIAGARDPRWRTWFTETILLQEFKNEFYPTNGHATLVDQLLLENQPDRSLDIVFEHLEHGLAKQICFQDAWMNRGIQALLTMGDSTDSLVEFRELLQLRLPNAGRGERARINKALGRLKREFPSATSQRYIEIERGPKEEVTAP